LLTLASNVVITPSPLETVNMDAQITDNTISSTSTNDDEQTNACADASFHQKIQVNKVSSTTSSDAEAIMLSLVGFD
jgi:hypothetical protein